MEVHRRNSFPTELSVGGCHRETTPYKRKQLLQYLFSVDLLLYLCWIFYCAGDFTVECDAADLRPVDGGSGLPGRVELPGVRRQRRLGGKCSARVAQGRSRDWALVSCPGPAGDPAGAAGGRRHVPVHRAWRDGQRAGLRTAHPRL